MLSNIEFNRISLPEWAAQVCILACLEFLGVFRFVIRAIGSIITSLILISAGVSTIETPVIAVLSLSLPTIAPGDRSL